MLCALADGVDALPVRPSRLMLVGGGARSEAVRRIAPSVFGAPVIVPPVGEYVARGAARQAAWVLAESETAPAWPLGGEERYDAEAAPEVREQYGRYRDALED
jgi:xylulokinase